MAVFVEVKSNGTVNAKKGSNPRALYDHQKQAMRNLDLIDELATYSTLVVLPTGSGKTYTASLWLLKNALNEQKKILWIAHRKLLLDQAAESFQDYAYMQYIPQISSFRYRIISGDATHDKTIHIDKEDNLLVVSKDSLGRSIERIDAWLDGEDEIYFVIDEAHHSTAKSYRNIIEHVKGRIKNVKLIGLTATPFRTGKNEEGLLAKIFCQGVGNKGEINKSGIAYRIGLKDLINRQILSRPIFESYYTDESIGGNIGKRELERLLQMDQLPKSIIEQLQENAGRNNRIVETYKKGQKKYGQTIVFAINVTNAIALARLFNDAGIRAEFVVSDIKDMATGITISAEDNERKIESYRKGETKVLINVNILTEGIDLPQTKTVFLTRPTVSTILMTQMVGRALRGEAAGGTKEAYIVSFIDQWNDYISWVSPESLVINDDEFMKDNPKDRLMYEMRLIAISKIEEFAKMLDDSVDTSELEMIPFEKSIPIGMYAFTWQNEKGMDASYQVMVYDSTKKAYEKMMKELPELAKDADIDEDGYLSSEELQLLSEQCRDTYFTGKMIPPYDQRDIMHILQYHSLYGDVPKFHSFDDIDRSKLDVTAIAQTILDEDMGPKRKKEYIDEIWNQADDNLLRIYFPNKLAFLNRLSIEEIKLANPDITADEKNVVFGKRDIEDMTLHAIGKHMPEEEKRLRDLTFKKAKDKDGYYVCNRCGKVRSKSRIRFQVDHIKPMNKGGKTVPENLQILCRACNMRKGDRE